MALESHDKAPLSAEHRFRLRVRHLDMMIGKTSSQLVALIMLVREHVPSPAEST